MAEIAGHEPKPSDADGSRVETLDVLRGFAVFGILTVNMGLFGDSIFAMVLGKQWPGWVDRAADWAIGVFAEGKFYSLFSMLFGIGFSLQIERVRVPVYLRRLFILLLIGLAHAYLLWFGDILALYAVLGFVLLLFRKCRPTTLLVWAVIFMLTPLLLNAAIVSLIELAKLTPEGAKMIESEFASQRAELIRSAEQAQQAYGSGTYSEQWTQRVRDNLALYSILPFFAPHVMTMFLVGLAIGKRRLWENPSVVRRALGWGLAVGLVSNIVSVWARDQAPRAEPTWLGLLADTTFAFGAPALSFFYASSIILLRDLRWLAPVGRMALTNYLLQTLVCTTIFNAFGLYGRIGPAWGLAIAAAIFATQVILCNLWMRRFSYGPMEWIWRTATYGRLPRTRPEVK
jgi:uncharacterized protein